MAAAVVPGMVLVVGIEVTDVPVADVLFSTAILDSPLIIAVLADCGFACSCAAATLLDVSVDNCIASLAIRSFLVVSLPDSTTLSTVTVEAATGTFKLSSAIADLFSIVLIDSWPLSVEVRAAAGVVSISTGLVSLLLVGI